MTSAARDVSEVKALLRGEHPSGTPLVLQCVGVAPTRNATLLALSDGRFWTKATTVPHFESLAVDGTISVGTRLRLRNFSLQTRRGIRMPHVTEADVLDTVETMGNPERLDWQIHRNGSPGEPSTPETGSLDPAVTQRGNQGAEHSPASGPAVRDTSRATAEATPGVAADRDPNGNSHPSGGVDFYDHAPEAHGPTVRSDPFMSPLQVEAGRQPDTPAAPQRPQPVSRISAASAQADGRAATPTRRRLDFGGRVGALDLRPSDAVQPSASAEPQNVRRAPASFREPGMTLVRDLYAYIPNFRIKLKVLSRSEISSWDNKNGSGRRTSWHFADAEGGEVGGVAWNEQADRLHPLLPQGSVAIISGGMVKPAFGGRKGLSITLQYTTTVTPCRDAAMMPRLHYEFAPSIAAIETLQMHSFTEVIGLVYGVGLAVTSDTKYGRSVRKRSITLVDESFCTIEVTIWGEEADGIGQKLEQLLDTSPEQKPLLAVKNVKLSEFNGGVNLSASSGALFEIEPNHPRSGQLREWGQTQGREGLDASSFRNLSRDQGRGLTPVPRLTLEEALACDLGSEPSMYIMVNAVLTYVDYDCVYPGCTRPSMSESQVQGRADKPRQCQKKMRQDAEGLWYCETCCDRSEPEWRFRADAVFQDHTGQLKCIAFADAGEQLLGVGATRYHEMLEQAESREAAQALCQQQQGKRLMAKLRAQHHTWNNVTSLQFTLLSLWPLDFRAESRKLLETIKKMAGPEK